VMHGLVSDDPRSSMNCNSMASHEVHASAARFAAKREEGQPKLTLSFCLESSPSGKARTAAMGTILPLDTLTPTRS
jgi:hypothetical protein